MISAIMLFVGLALLLEKEDIKWGFGIILVIFSLLLLRN
mgnify:CR=1 FL=1